MMSVLFLQDHKAPLRPCFLHQSQKLWTVFNSGEETKSSHQFPALKETSELFIVGSETKLFRNTFLKSTTKEMIPESIVLVCSGCFSGSDVWRRALLLLVISWWSQRHSSYNHSIITDWQTNTNSVLLVRFPFKFNIWHLNQIYRKSVKEN